MPLLSSPQGPSIIYIELDFGITAQSSDSVESPHCAMTMPEKVNPFSAFLSKKRLKCLSHGDDMTTESQKQRTRLPQKGPGNPKRL